MVSPPFAGRPARFWGVALPSLDAVDCNEDGTSDYHDLSCTNESGVTPLVLNEFGLTPGDLDGDGVVAFADFLTLADHFNQPGNYIQGDIDVDGVVGFSDFLILADNFNDVSAVAAIPEPSTALLTILGSVTFSAVRSKQYGYRQ